MAEEKEQNEALNEETTSQEQQTAEEVTDSSAENADNTSETAAPTAEEQIAVLNDKYIRLYSEFDNYRKRTNKEKLELISTASAGVLKDMLSVLDDFERAIANNEQVEDINAVKEGFQLIHHKFKNILEAKGLKQMVAKGEAFDPELHEAIANVPAPSDDLKGKVVDDVERGYFLNDKVVRYAKVVVGN
ncbi:MAG: nucleotide exchange factor GrpE [Fluviicola sp.]|jgi:molecular chaperone GrpE|nr:nucleotide exchange factor GrpE [Fluviicola sp.]